MCSRKILAGQGIEIIRGIAQNQPHFCRVIAVQVQHNIIVHRENLPFLKIRNTDMPYINKIVFGKPRNALSRAEGLFFIK